MEKTSCFPSQSLLLSLKWILKLFYTSKIIKEQTPLLIFPLKHASEQRRDHYRFFVNDKKKRGEKKKRLSWLCKTLFSNSWPTLDHNSYYFKTLYWKFCWNLTKQVSALMDYNFPASECNLLCNTGD